MYGIVENGVLVKSDPKKIMLGKTIVYNPTIEYLEQTGEPWIELTFTDAPDDAPDGFHYESSWTDDGVQQWSLVEDSTEPSEAEYIEAAKILLGEE